MYPGVLVYELGQGCPKSIPSYNNPGRVCILVMKEIIGQNMVVKP